MTEYTISWSLYNGGKGWVARIVGLDPRYGFAREFCRATDRHSSRSGSTGTSAFLLDDGLYEVNERGGRHFVLVADGVAPSIDRAKMVARLNNS